MPNPGKFHGKRKAFLMSKKEMFAAGVEKNQMGDVLLQILRAYFKRFPLDLPDDQEPTDAELEAVRDDEADPEHDVEMEDLTGDEFNAEAERRRERAALLEARKGQIKRWFLYRYMHENNFNPRTMDTTNPYNVVLLQLSGMSPKQKPRLKTAANLWCKDPDAMLLIQTEFEKIAPTIEPKYRAAARAAIVKRLFDALPSDTKQEFADIAQAEHEEALAVYDEVAKGRISTRPEDRQKCISGLVRFLQPILDRVAEATGFKLACIAGGPEPAAGGRLSIISICAGTSSGPVKMTFGQAERAAYRETWVPTFGRFLRTCYTPEECRLQRLPSPDAQATLQSMAMEAPGAIFDSVDISTHTTAPSPPAPTGSTVVRAVDEDSVSTAASGTANPPAAPPVPRSVVPSVLSTNRASSAPPPSSPPGFSAAPHGSTTPRRMSAPPPSAITPPGSTLPSTPVGDVLPRMNGLDMLLLAVDRALTNVVADDRPSSPISLAVTPAHSRRASPAPPHERTPAARPGGALGTKRPPPTVDDTSLAPAAKRVCLPRDGILPESAPEWMKKGVSMFGVASLGAKWQELVAAWIVYEGSKEFKEEGRLSSAKRPKMIGDWIKNARNTEWRPKGTLLADRTAAEHNEWWTALQPDWRRGESGALEVQEVKGDWGGLHVRGKNGLLSALASLFFWSTALEDPASDAAWCSAVSDCLWVLQQLSALRE